MAFTEQQQAILNRVRGRLSNQPGQDDEDERNNSAQRQWEILDEVRSRIEPQEPVASSVEEPGMVRGTADVAVGALTGVPKAVGALVGLGSLVPGVNYIADPISQGLYDLGEMGDEALLSDYQLQKNEELGARIAEAAATVEALPEDSTISERVDHIYNTIVAQGGEAGAYLSENPGQIVNFIAQTAPHILLGGAAGKAVKGGAAVAGVNVGARTAGAVGEGLIAGGDATANIVRQDYEGVGTAYSPNRLAGAAAGIGTSLVSRGLAGRFDVDTLAAGGAADLMEGATRGGLLKAGTVSAAREGAEEFIQSGQEQAFTNVGQGKPFYEGVGSSAVIGAATGAGLGAGTGVLGQRSVNKQQNQLDAQAAAQRADAEAVLIKQQQEQAEREGLQRQAELEQQARVRREAAETFTPRKEFVAAREKEIKAQLEKDVFDPNTEMGADFERVLNENSVFDPADVESEAKKFVNAYQKERKADTEAQLNQEYVTALDGHAVKAEQARMAVEQNPTLLDMDQTEMDLMAPTDTNPAGRLADYNIPDAETYGVIRKMRDMRNKARQAQEKIDLTQASTEATPTNEAPAQKPPKKKDQLRALAAEKLGETFEQDHPELSQLLADGKGIYSRGKGKKSRFETMLDKIVAEQATTEATPEAAPVAQPEANLQETEAAPAAPEETAATTPVVEQAQTEPTPTEQTDDSSSVDALAGIEAQAVDYATEKLGQNWRTEQPQLVQLLKEKKYAGLQSNVDRIAAEKQEVAQKTNAVVEAFKQPLPPEVKLSPNEQKVFDVLNQAFKNNTQDEVVQSDGSLNPQRIADIAGLNSRQAAQTAIARLRPKIAKTYGLEQKQIKQRLAETKVKNVEAFDPNAANQEIEMSELGQSMGTVASANQGARDGMDQEDRDFLDNMDETPNRVQSKEERDAIRTELDKEIKADPAYTGARDTWNNGFEIDVETEADRISFDGMDAGSRFEFMSRYVDFQRGEYGVDELGTYYDDIRAAYLEDTQNATDQIADESGPTESAAIEETPRPDGGEVRQEGDDTAGDQPASAAEFEERAAKVTVTTKKRRKIDPKKAKTTNPRFGVRPDATQTASREVFEQELQKLTGQSENVRVHIFENEAEAIAAVDNGDIPKVDTAEIASVQPYGWVQQDGDGVPHAHFILDRIPAGGERAAFMHEIGGHVGIDTVIPEETRNQIATQIADWAGKDDGSLESRLARRAIERMDFATARGGVADGVVVSEAIAYFLEEATLEGVTPTSEGAIGNFVRQIYDAFVAAMEKLGLTTTELMPQDVVDMAYGAARFELVDRSLEPTTDAAPQQYPSYGLRDNQSQDTEKARSWVKRNFGATATQFYDDAAFIARNAVDSTKFLHQFIRDNRATMPSAQRWYNGMLEADKTRNDIRRSVEDVAIQARSLTPDRLEAVNDFIGKSTFFQKWGYDPEIEGREVKIDPVMQAAFLRLNEAEQQLVKNVFEHGERMRVRKQEIAKKLGVDGKFFTGAALEGPYAPLKRFGNFAGELKSQELLDAEATLREEKTTANQKRVDDLKSADNHYMISFFDTMGAAKQFTDANAENFPFAKASERAPDMESERVTNSEVFEKILGQLGVADTSDVDANSKKAFADMVKKMYIQSLDERSARTSGTRRMNRAGYEKNMIRSFLAHSRAEAAMIANMEHGAEINTALVEAAKEARVGSEELQSVYTMIAKHYRDTLVGKETPIQDRLAAMNSVYMLTTSVGYHVTNATQPVMVTVPKLAGDFKNYSGAWGALIRGYKVSTAATSMDSNIQVNIDIDKAPPKYRKLLQELELRQLLDVGMEEDLSEFDRFNTGYEPLNRLSDSMGKIVHKLYQVARYVEAHNRISAAIAAYDMATANPSVPRSMKMTPEEYATSIVEDTQGNFARFDAPYLVKALPKLTTQYRKYQLMMAWNYASAFKKSTPYLNKEFSPEEVATARRTMGYLLAHAGLFAGATGVPLATTIAPYFLAMASGDDEPQDLERWIRDKVEDERLADVLSRGVFSFVGIDMSTKLSQSKIFHPFPYVDFEATEDGVKDVFFNALAGPAGTTALNFGRAASYFDQGDYMKGTEYMVPKGVRTLIESYRLGTEGYTMKNGDVIVDPREIDVKSLLLNAIGIPATDINQIKWTRGQQYELEQYFSGESSRIRREYIRANDSRDTGRMSELRDEWRDLQQQKDRVRPFFNNARNALRRQPMSDLFKAPRRQDRRERRAGERFN